MLKHRPRRALLGAFVAGFTLVPLFGGTASAAAVPYTDAAAKGSITLCDSRGNSVTHGDTRDVPFANFAIASQGVPARWADKQTKATLYAFQPRKGVDPGDWSGLQLSGSSFFSKSAHPMTEITTGDKNLFGAVGTYPTQWDGLLQLRIYLSNSKVGGYSDTYPAVNLKVVGTRWTAVDAGRTPCKAGKAYSSERILLPASAFPKPSKAGAASAGASRSPTPAATTSSPGSTSTSSVTSDASRNEAGAGGGGSGSRTLWVILGLALLAGLGGTVAIARMRRA